MPRQTQLGAHKNPAPHSRQHGLRFAEEANSQTVFANQAAQRHAATVGEAINPNRLLTVREVADLLQVPVSWVYARTRKRSLERLPGYRLGKYWRLQRETVLAWVESQQRGSSAA
jgi:excisionase family DNA binding protein